MAGSGLKERVAVLEAELASVKRRLHNVEAERPEGSWLDQVYGSFANDPAHEVAMRLGRQYRESLRPRPRGRRHGRSRHRSP